LDKSAAAGHHPGPAPPSSSSSCSAAEVIRGGLDPASEVAFMLDQCHNVEDRIPNSKGRS
jgi:hypothetical protein